MTDTGAIDDVEQSSSESQSASSYPVARALGGSQAFNIINLNYELREIVVAQGLQSTNSYIDEKIAINVSKGEPDIAAEWRSVKIPDGLTKKFPSLSISGDEAEYVSERQRVRFLIRVIDTKDKFKQALETPGLHVIYSGHARYGRGPCFGLSDDPGDDWEQGSDITTGIFRMGFPVIGVHLSEIRKHGYRFLPVPSRMTIEKEWRHPELPTKLRHVSIPEDLVPYVLAQGTPIEESYWGFRDREGDGLVLWAGWESTISAPMDLGATNMRCRCFCGFGCSTFVHWYPILRKRKEWKRSETERFAYFTRRPSKAYLRTAWLEALFTYPRRNAFESWYPSLQWAVQRTNRILAAKNEYYGVI